MKTHQEQPERILVDSQEAAQMLAISTRKLWSLTDCGEIPCIRIGRAVRYAVEDLHQWVRSKTTQ